MAAVDTSLCNNGVLRKAMRRLGQVYDAAIAPSGLRATQFAVLAEIAALEGPTLRELANALVMDLSALGHTLKPLARDGVVTVTADPHDRRAKRVLLTEAGMERFRKAQRLWHGAQQRFEATLGVEQAANLRLVLGHIASPSFAEALAATPD
ncbi:MAG: transcriptional regulator, MarR family [Xanthobacteraceae bacterium]|nr:transcriptional regulator, MarR family [Xanthobacteraceae bacterium]